jgi:aspartate-semialdehyde dehydrogenase
MPPSESLVRLAIAGATSLRGKDLKYYLEEHDFPASEIRLLDEELLSGTLTEVGGEPTIVQAVNESSFQGLRFVFFAGSAAFAAQHGPAAERAGASVIDMTGGLWSGDRSRLWIPGLDSLLPPPPFPLATGDRFHTWVAPSSPAIIACSLAAAFADLSPAQLAITFFQPVSERGEAGVSELEGQTTKLLCLQTIPQQVFDTQVAFNLTARWGAGSKGRLSDVRAAIGGEVARYLDKRISLPAITLVQAPVFYGHAFSAWAGFKQAVDQESLKTRLASAGFTVVARDEPSPSNLSAAGETQVLIAEPERDDNLEHGYWFWGAADNFRLASVNATRIAERLLAS